MIPFVWCSGKARDARDAVSGAHEVNVGSGKGFGLRGRRDRRLYV